MFKKFVSVITNYLTDYFDMLETYDDVGVDELMVKDGCLCHRRFI